MRGNIFSRERDPQKTRSKLFEDKPIDPVHIEVQFGLTVWPHCHDQHALQLDDPPDLYYRETDRRVVPCIASRGVGLERCSPSSARFLVRSCRADRPSGSSHGKEFHSQRL